MTEELIMEHNGIEIVKLTTPATGSVCYAITFPHNTTIHLTPEEYDDLYRAFWMIEQAHIEEESQ